MYFRMRNPDQQMQEAASLNEIADGLVKPLARIFVLEKSDLTTLR